MIPLDAAIPEPLPVLTAFLQGRFRLRGRFRHPTYPLYTPRVQLPHVRLAVDAVISHIHTWFCIRLSQLLLDGHDCCEQADFVTAVAIKRLQEQRDLPIMGGSQGQHPLLEILPMIAISAVWASMASAVLPGSSTHSPALLYAPLTEKEVVSTCT